MNEILEEIIKQVRLQTHKMEERRSLREEFDNLNEELNVIGDKLRELWQNLDKAVHDATA